MKALIAGLFLASTVMAGTALAQTVIIKAGRLIDGRGGAPTAPAMVRVEGQRITAVGSTLAGNEL